MLAKSYPGCASGEEAPDYAKLVPHLRAVEQAGASIVEAAGKLILQQLDLPITPWHSRLMRALSVACLCHDIGKANDGFQNMVRGKLSPKRQPARHELLSALLLADKQSQVRAWAFTLLSEGGKCDDAEELLNCVIAAVGGHHLKLAEDWNRASIALRDGGCGATTLQMLLTHPDLKSLFGETVKETNSFDLTGNETNFLGHLRFPFNIASNLWQDRLETEPGWWRFAATVKALTVAADVAGSAVLPKRGPSPAKWVQRNLAETQRITTNQMDRVVAARLKGAKTREFQELIATARERVTLVEAGCGSGKTAAAYMWAATHARDKKLFFCYPTTGTSTEGFLGYVYETEVEAELMHSRAIVDLELVAKVKQDEEEKGEQVRDQALRIESLRAWSPQVVVCTADTVLALARNNRRGLYSSPAILMASFVFDELHAYDDRMLTAVIALIKALPGAHFLLMTASLPKVRKDFLLNQIENVEQVPTPKELEELPRYSFEYPTKEENAYHIAREAVIGKRRVLWICNTVAKAQGILERLNNDRVPARTYHSRFKYIDRVRQHRKIIRWFKPPKLRTGIVAVTTQVAEMSLDLDADLLITEIAPIPAMIQRLGRLNRRITPEEPGQPRTAYFLMPERPERYLPYEEKEIENGRLWVEELKQLNRPLRQADLATVFRSKGDEEEPDFNTRVEWLDSGWFAYPREVREASVSASVILPEDEAACRQDVRELIRNAIPMNFSRLMEDWREYKGNFIAKTNTIDYDKRRGARWLHE